jgi:porin
VKTKTEENKMKRSMIKWRATVGVLTGAALIMTGAARVMAGVGAPVEAKEVDTVKCVQKCDKATGIWAQPYLFGDWGGARTKLEDKGVTFDFNIIDDLQTDLTGNQTHHLTNFGRIRGSVTVDLEKLADIDGKFFVTGMWQFGKNLGAEINTFTSPSSIAGYNSFRLDEAWYEQGLFNHKLRIKVGQIAAVNDFGQTGLFLMNDETGYSPNINFYPLQPFSPSGKPGVVLTIDPSGVDDGIYLKVGAFTGRGSDPYKPDTSGLNWGQDFDNGVAGTFEVGYNQNGDYAGVYKIGASFNDMNRYNDLLTGEAKRGDLVAYLTAQKTVWHPVCPKTGKMDADRGLDLLVQIMGAPEDRNPIRFEGLIGAVYNGPFACRPQDKAGLGVIVADASSAASSFSKRNGGGTAGTQVALELSYQYNPAPWLSIQPDVQYIVNPVGYGVQPDSRDNILIVGLRTMVRF